MDMTSFYNRYHTLSRTQKKIFDWMMDNRLEVGYLSLKELSVHVGVSEVSILHFCNAMGYDNYVPLREAFRNYARDAFRNTVKDALPVAKKDSALTEAERETVRYYCGLFAGSLGQSIRGLDMDQLYQCAKSLMKVREIFIFGHDASKIPADYLAHRLNFLKLRARAVKLGDDDTVQMTLAALTKEDAAIFFSFPPYHYPSQDVANFVKHRGAEILTFTDGPESPVVVVGSRNLFCKIATPFFFNALSVPLAFVDILVSCMATELGDAMQAILDEVRDVNDFFSFHKNDANGGPDD